MKALIAFLILIGLPGPLLSAASPKKTHERAWLGGEYKLARNGSLFPSRGMVAAFPKLERQRAGIFVSAVHTNAPVALGGLRAGDLILGIDDRSTTSLNSFRKLVDSRSPGDVVRLSVHREGEVVELPITLGREAYQSERTVGLGLLLSGEVDLVPNPDFSLFAAGFKRRSHRLELQSPETRFLLRTRSENGRAGSAPAREGWHAPGWPSSASAATSASSRRKHCLPRTSYGLRFAQRLRADTSTKSHGFTSSPRAHAGRRGCGRRDRG